MNDSPLGMERGPNAALPWSIPIRVGVVGVGYWGPNLVRNLLDVDDVELVSVCDTERERLDVIRRRYPGVRRTTRYEDLLCDTSIEAIVIATPVSTHFELGMAALRAGKHVFVEKPLAASAAEAAALIELAEKQNLLLMPGHTFLYSSSVNVIRDLIRSGELGSIYFVSMSRVNLGLHQSDVSVTWDLGPHDFSILRYWLDESPSYVAAMSRSCVIPGTPDVAFINLEFPSGTIGHVELAWLAPSKLRRTTIVGSEKMVVYDDTSSEPVRIYDSGAMLPDPESFGEYALTYRTGDILVPRVDVVEPLYAEMADFAACIRSRETPRSSSELGLDVVCVSEAVDRSLAAGGTRVRVHGAPLVAVPDAS
ncbi:MAG TPA: Gfo/Idh/MocA family oxidoreductase [Gaiellaceae bacterium]|nr:Gfo/Idh/MocA family oxidoreductase [Gaiellaceae bacterium]